jgi:hypothetical protein
MTADSHFRPTLARDGRRGDEPMDTRVRKTLRMLSRHLATLRRCYRTRDRTVLDNLPAFVAGRQLHTFVLDSRAVIHEMEILGVDAVPMTARTRKLFAALRSYLADLEGVLVIEPPTFRLPPRQIDLRCIAFFPEVVAFADRIEVLIAAG